MSSETGDGTPDRQSADEDGKESEWRRKRRLSRVFGDTLPDRLADPGDTPHSARGRDWYERNRPPHHE
ncbi:hypothetical protein GCM10022231_36110 [Gordonia caeni]|uniref:Uncharacterized protein n=1 Tax=Gordonia caeni TaxID=1007097 RepID=A0ABP7PU69_9ACTN